MFYIPLADDIFRKYSQMFNFDILITSSIFWQIDLLSSKIWFQ